jgi:diguanylate cyclase (GGDEF)-like protein
MELKIYLRILLRKWWIVLPAFLVTFTSTVVFTFTQAPIYEATTTYVVALTDASSDVWGLDVLSRQGEIANTYAEVALSRTVRQAAADDIHLSSEQQATLSVSSRLKSGTNVVEITVEGTDPTLVKDFANAVGSRTEAYARELYEAYDLRLLDSAPLPSMPVRPNNNLNLALGAVFGLALGAGVAFLAEYLRAPIKNAANLGILDDETGAYNEHYFVQRLSEEMSRAQRNQYPLSLALMNVDQMNVVSQTTTAQARSELLRKVTIFLKQHLREEDIIARLDNTVFAFLLPDTSEEQAKAAMEKLQTRIAWTPFEIETSGIKLNLNSAVGVTFYNYNGTAQNEFLDQANQALQQAEVAGYGKVQAFSNVDKEH